MVSNNFKYKSHVDLNDFLKINPMLGIIFFYFVGYAKKNKLPVLVTSISDDAPNRKSDTHKTFRAIDISSKKWNDFHINRIVYRINSMYRDFGTGPKNKIKRAIIHHDSGTGNHFHIQVNRLAQIED